MMGSYEKKNENFLYNGQETFLKIKCCLQHVGFLTIPGVLNIKGNVICFASTFPMFTTKIPMTEIQKGHFFKDRDQATLTLVTLKRKYRFNKLRRCDQLISFMTANGVPIASESAAASSISGSSRSLHSSCDKYMNHIKPTRKYSETDVRQQDAVPAQLNRRSTFASCAPSLQLARYQFTENSQQKPKTIIPFVQTMTHLSVNDSSHCKDHKDSQERVTERSEVSHTESHRSKTITPSVSSILSSYPDSPKNVYSEWETQSPYPPNALFRILAFVVGHKCLVITIMVLFLTLHHLYDLFSRLHLLHLRINEANTRMNYLQHHHLRNEQSITEGTEVITLSAENFVVDQLKPLFERWLTLIQEVALVKSSSRPKS